ncbi:hypothetical protein F5Y14DRAFT_127523 [Nemania sp. NC0429]|nr:hypothetical protein F5Y14DRAFT_127523 [Nemania sp. NC0429]
MYFLIAGLAWLGSTLCWVIGVKAPVWAAVAAVKSRRANPAHLAGVELVEHQAGDSWQPRAANIQSHFEAVQHVQR